MDPRSPYKVCGPHVVTQILIPTFEWYIAGLLVKNGHRKNIVCYDEIGLCTQNVFTSPGSVLTPLVGLCDFLHRKRTHFDLLKLFASQFGSETEIPDLQLPIG